MSSIYLDFFPFLLFLNNPSTFAAVFGGLAKMDTRDRIFDLLDRRKMEQKTFAAQIGVKESVVTDWRRGKSNSYNRYLVQIAQVLGTTSEYLLTGKTQSSPPQKRDRLPDVWYMLTDAQRARAEEFMRFLQASGTDTD